MRDYSFAVTSKGGAWKKCYYCGKMFFVNDMDKWVYKRYSRADENSARIYFHTWSCLRKFDEEHEKIVAERRQAGNKRAWERRKGKTDG